MTRVWYNLNTMLIGALKLLDSEMIIFRWFVGFMVSSKMQSFEKNGRRYFWVLHKKTADDLKFMQGKSERQVLRIFKKLVEKKVLYFLLVQGNSSWYALTDIGVDLATPLLKAKHKQIIRPMAGSYNQAPPGKFQKKTTFTSGEVLKSVMHKFNKK